MIILKSVSSKIIICRSSGAFCCACSVNFSLIRETAASPAYIFKDLKNVDLCCSFSQFMA